jgi:hypothetical protein
MQGNRTFVQVDTTAYPSGEIRRADPLVPPSGDPEHAEVLLRRW